MISEFDYIVIGAGSAGCVVANRLSASGKSSVLVLEAGGEGRGVRFRLPIAATKLWFDPRSSWSLWSEEEPGLGGRRLPVPRGKALGGSSSINGTIYNRGSPHDYDQWGDFGLEGWDYSSLLPYFRSIEKHWRGADTWHGGEGEVAVTALRQRSPLTPHVLDAALQMGWPIIEDFLGPQTEGVGVPDLNVDRRGRRVSAADAFLHPVRARKNLTIKTSARVLRVVFDKGRAVGAEFMHAGQRQMARARCETIVSAGAIASPQLLLLSGIGAADASTALGIAPIVDLPAVGRGLTDQPGASFEFQSKLPLSFARTLRADRFAAALAQWAIGLGGPAAGPPLVAMGALRFANGGRSPDLRMMVAAATPQSKVWYPGVSPRVEHRLLMNFALAHPKSRGSITLASADPAAAPRIQYNLLTEPEDIAGLRKIYLMMREFAGRPALASVFGGLTRPQPEPTSDQELDDYLRSVAGTTAHPLGSCRMGGDAASVVDGQCRVRGVAALRVIDGSVFPTQISGNPHAAIMMLGARVADMILRSPS